MSEVVVQGEMFKIKGDEPTPKEQLAIESVLAAKNKNKGVLDFNQQMELMITPEDVLSDAAKGKYNKDTESFLSSPTFARIVTEVGLSIAGAIGGAALAPFTGGASLAATGVMAARVARIARPLLNLSAKKQKLFGAVAGAGVGGGAGAAIAQSFDPRESIVKEVARGFAQGAAGEVLGFGMAAGLAKGYNKITGASIRQLDGAKDAAATLARDGQFFDALKDIKTSGKIDVKKLQKLKDGVKNKDNPNIFDIEPLSKEQIDILTTPKLSAKAIDKAADLLDDTKSIIGQKKIKAQLANIIPGKLTDNPMTETLSEIATSSMIGSASIRAGENMARRSTMQNIENFVDTVLYQLPKKGLDEAEEGMAIGELLNSQITKQYALYNDTKNKMFNIVSGAVNKNLKRADGTFDPKYDVIYSGPGSPNKINVLRTPAGKTPFNEDASGIGQYIDKVLFDNRNLLKTSEGKEVLEMLGPLLNAKGRTDYSDFWNIYKNIAAKNVSPVNKPVQAELLARMQALLNDSPLPGNIGLLRQDASQFTKLGAEPFRTGVLKTIMNTERGHEAIYKNIIRSGSKSYYEAFFNLIDKGKNSYKLSNGTVKSFDIFPNKELMKDQLRGQFFKDYLKNSVEGGNVQYPKLLAGKSKKFLEDHAFLLDEKLGFLTKGQIQNIKQYTNRIQFIEGAIKPANTAGSNPGMFIQLNQAGQISQLIGIVGFGSGTIDPGAASFFVLGPLGLSKAFANPKVAQLMIDGLGGGTKTIDDYAKLNRYIGQLSTALVSNGIVSSEEAADAVRQVQDNKDAYEKYFKTGKYEGSIIRRDNPADAPAIGLSNGQTNIATNRPTENNSAQLPSFTPSNLPMSGSTQQSNTELAQALNLFSKGGIVSAKKSF